MSVTTLADQPSAVSADQLLHEIANDWRPKSSPEESPQPPQAVRKMKLAYLTTEYPKASHTFVRRELKALESRGHDIVRVSVRRCDAVVDPADVQEAAKTINLLGESRRELLGSFLKVLFTRPRNFARAARKTLALWQCSNRGLIPHVAYLVEACKLFLKLQQQNVEHVHVHFGKNAADLALLVKCLGGPSYSMAIHGPGEFDAPVGYALGPKVEGCTFAAAISHYGAAQLRRWVPLNHCHKLHVIRCTINDDFLSQYQPQTVDTNQFVCIGRLTPQKGQLLLVEAVAQLVAQGVDVKLVLAGDGDIRDIIEQRISELGITNNVQITGWIGEADVRRHLLESRAMVLPSFAEGLPVAIMEAMALGRTVISTCITGIPELLKHKENGWMITAGCVEDIAAAMKEALNTPLAELNNMAKAGHDRVRQQHLAETEAAKLEALLLQEHS